MLNRISIMLIKEALGISSGGMRMSIAGRPAMPMINKPPKSPNTQPPRVSTVITPSNAPGGRQMPGRQGQSSSFT